MINVPIIPKEESIDLTRKEIDKVALIDADRFKYIVVHNMFYEINTNGENHSKELLETLIESCLKRYVFDHYKAKAYVFCFSCSSKDVFRKHLAYEKGYKAQRAGRDDPYYYENKYADMAYVFHFIRDNQITLSNINLEADDIMSIVQSENTFIHSIDKDMKQVPGLHYDENTRELIEMSEKDSFSLLMQQTILGDTSDNIPGLKGCGPKFVEKLSKFEGEQLIQMVINAFVNKHGAVEGLDMFVEMYNLVKLKSLRGDYAKERYQGFIEITNSLI